MIFVHEYNGFTFSGIAEYEPAQPQTFDEPGYNAIATIISLYVRPDTRDMVDIIDPYVIQQLERKIVQDQEDH